MKPKRKEAMSTICPRTQKPLPEGLVPSLSDLIDELEMIEGRLSVLPYYCAEAMSLRDSRHAIEWELRGYDNLYSD